MLCLVHLRVLTKAGLSIQTLVIGTHDAPLDDVNRIRHGAGDWLHPDRALQT